MISVKLSSTYFKMPNGNSKIFSSGTIQYSWSLDDYSPIYSTGVRIGERVHPVMTNQNAQVFTENMLGCLINNVCQ